MSERPDTELRKSVCQTNAKWNSMMASCISNFCSMEIDLHCEHLLSSRIRYSNMAVEYRIRKNPTTAVRN